jgi:hypothetical protein
MTVVELNVKSMTTNTVNTKHCAAFCHGCAQTLFCVGIASQPRKLFRSDSK